jgi:uncharacterized membrane protein YeaQ/YmgE (transglycosylase-associated protein family)
MELGALIGWLVIGALAGWIAGKLMKGGGFGLVGNIIVGIVGAVVGGLVFDILGFEMDDGFVGSLITAVLGAVILLWIVRLLLLRKLKGK